MMNGTAGLSAERVRDLIRSTAALGSNGLRSQQILDPDRQLSHAHAGGVVDGGGDRRSDPCQADLTNAAGAQFVQCRSGCCKNTTSCGGASAWVVRI
jgi:hypothetical protein